MLLLADFRVFSLAKKCLHRDLFHSGKAKPKLAFKKMKFTAVALAISALASANVSEILNPEAIMH